MTAARYAMFQGIDNDHAITKETDYEFLYHLQKGLLLALKEQELLSTTQYRQAEESLRKQHRNRAREQARAAADAP